MPAMPTSDAKAAEFARLFNLFDSLASRRARTTTTTNNDRDAPATTAERQNLLPLPDDFSHVLKNLSTIATAGVRKPRLEYTQRPLRNTLACISGSRHASDVSAASASGESTISDTEGDVDEEFLAQFPLSDEEGYPFTFKHMVHKLYPKDDWARAVKEMLEKSKNEFKPLAEQLEAKAKGYEENENDEEKGAEENIVRFKVPTSPGAGRRGSVFGIGSASRAISPLPTRSPGSGLQPEVRALKKRCVGRRLSMSGPLNAFGGTGTGTAPAGTIGGGWVYAAAISSAEHPTAATFSSCHLPHPRRPRQRIASISTARWEEEGRTCPAHSRLLEE
ncbi:hypothetical protein NLJ89_g3423 [Agrocybe chaxingu]|uniref:Uncharacterized protein n=1 Tax=Agrocybe chaxingu TaxID=84603 RepID=A0A9W8K5N0_9AGAR|nr:hypothetical protein NLJ89_g3423 [Agrocybe chaxingu]